MCPPRKNPVSKAPNEAPTGTNPVTPDQAQTGASAVADPSPRRTLLLQIATQLAAAQIATLDRQQAGIPLDHPSHDQCFRACLRRADRLIDSSGSDDTSIYAEQLFPASDEKISENKIGQEFEKWKWPQLRSRDSFTGLMAEVAQWFEARLSQLEEDLLAEYGPTGVQESRFIYALFNFCGRSSGLPLEGPWPPEIEKLAERITSFVEESAQARSASEGIRAVRARDLAIERVLIRLCFGDRTPVNRESEEEGLRRFYRPWGLFRYLRAVGKNDPSAQPLLEKLAVPRSQVSSDFEPFEEVKADWRLNYDLGILEELAERIYESSIAASTPADDEDTRQHNGIDHRSA